MFKLTKKTKELLVIGALAVTVPLMGSYILQGTIFDIRSMASDLVQGEITKSQIKKIGDYTLEYKYNANNRWSYQVKGKSSACYKAGVKVKYFDDNNQEIKGKTIKGSNKSGRVNLSAADIEKVGYVEVSLIFSSSKRTAACKAGKTVNFTRSGSFRAPEVADVEFEAESSTTDDNNQEQNQNTDNTQEETQNTDNNQEVN